MSVDVSSNSPAILENSIFDPFVAEKGYDPQFGARPLHRAIQKYIEDPLAEFILNESPAEDSHLQATLNEAKDGLVIAYFVPAEEKEEREVG